MDLKQLRYFLRIADLGSFTRASESLHIAQPALSRHIKLLEEELGVPLFVRNGRGVKVTHAGRQLQEHANQLMGCLANAKRSVQQLCALPTGSVSLGISPQVGARFIADIMCQFRDRFPGGELKIREGLDLEIVRDIKLGHLDIGLVHNPSYHQGVFSKTVFQEEIFLIASGREARLGDECKFDHLAKLPLVLTAKPSPLRNYIEAMADEKKVSLNVHLAVDSFPAIKELVASGEGFGLLPYAMIHDEVARGHLRPIRIVNPAITRFLAIAVPKKRVGSLATEKLAELIQQRIESFIEIGIWRGVPFVDRAGPRL